MHPEGCHFTPPSLAEGTAPQLHPHALPLPLSSPTATGGNPQANSQGQRPASPSLSSCQGAPASFAVPSPAPTGRGLAGLGPHRRLAAAGRGRSLFSCVCAAPGNLQFKPPVILGAANSPQPQTANPGLSDRGTGLWG